MKVSFRQSGGFTGLLTGCELDSESLSKSDAEYLESLLKNFGTIGKQGIPPTRRGDIPKFEITLQTGDNVQKLKFDEMSLPEGLEPLLEFLQARAKPCLPR